MDSSDGAVAAVLRDRGWFVGDACSYIDDGGGEVYTEAWFPPHRTPDTQVVLERPMLPYDEYGALLRVVAFTDDEPEGVPFPPTPEGARFALAVVEHEEEHHWECGCSRCERTRKAGLEYFDAEGVRSDLADAGWSVGDEGEVCGRKVLAYFNPAFPGKDFISVRDDGRIEAVVGGKVMVVTAGHREAIKGVL